MGLSSHVSMMLRSLAGAAGGLGVGIVVAVVPGLDNRLVNAYRADRALSYRVVFFGLLFGAAVLAGRSWDLGRRPLRTVIGGAACGYLSGFATWWVMQSLYVSAGSALIALRQFPDGLIAPLMVPLLTFSWAFGAIVFAGAHLILRSLRAGPTPAVSSPK